MLLGFGVPKALDPKCNGGKRTGCSFKVVEARVLVWALSMNLDPAKLTGPERHEAKEGFPGW